MPSNRPRQRNVPNRRPNAPHTGSRAPGPNARRRPGPAPAASSGWRTQLERASYPVLFRLTQAPKWLVGGATAALLLAGLLAPNPFGTLAMALVTLFLIWLLVLAWPKLNPQGRLVRAIIALGAAAVVVLRAAGRL